jgi:hypothetical protein
MSALSSAPQYIAGECLDLLPAPPIYRVCESVDFGARTVADYGDDYAAAVSAARFYRSVSRLHRRFFVVCVSGESSSIIWGRA